MIVIQITDKSPPVTWYIQILFLFILLILIKKPRFIFNKTKFKIHIMVCNLMDNSDVFKYHLSLFFLASSCVSECNTRWVSSNTLFLINKLRITDCVPGIIHRYKLPNYPFADINKAYSNEFKFNSHLLI